MEEMRKDLQQIKESQIRMEADLKYHIKRTDLLEERVEKHEERVERALAPMPTKEKVQIAAFIAAIVSATTQLLKYLGA